MCPMLIAFKCSSAKAERHDLMIQSLHDQRRGRLMLMIKSFHFAEEESVLGIVASA